MKSALLKKDVMRDLLTTAVNVHMRTRQPACFVLACDVSQEDSDGNVPALAHVLVLSADNAQEIETFLRGRTHIMLETLRKDFLE